MTYSETYLAEVAEIAGSIPPEKLEAMAEGIAAVRERGGRLFILGVGGGAGHASHAVNDFRKICHLESYTPTDHVSELTDRKSTRLNSSHPSTSDAVFCLKKKTE